LPLWADKGAFGITRLLSFEPNADRNRGKGESGQGIQALRLADASGEEGSPFAPTRSDCRQSDQRALAGVRGGQHHRADPSESDQ
jgi:hypothetical protein